jgi:hypothetical protein
MGQEERHTTMLEGGYGEFVGDIHQTFDIVPCDGAFSAMGLVVNSRV